MGDRSVVGFRTTHDAPTLYLYSHWGGRGLYFQLADALVTARPRWNDPAYATRICVSQIIGADWARETDYGLSIDTYGMPDDYRLMVVTWEDHTVTQYGIPHSAAGRHMDLGRRTFAGFIDLYAGVMA